MRVYVCSWAAMVQVSDEQLSLCLDPESNSIALIVKHLQHAQWKSLSIPRNKSAEVNRKSL